MASTAIRILGIDPGLRRTGWGVIDVDGNRLMFVACGSVETKETLPLAQRLMAIHAGLSRVLGDFTPLEAAVEQVKLQLPVWKRQEFADGSHEWTGSA